MCVLERIDREPQTPNPKSQTLDPTTGEEGPLDPFYPKPQTPNPTTGEEGSLDPSLRLKVRGPTRSRVPQERRGQGHGQRREGLPRRVMLVPR